MHEAPANIAPLALALQQDPGFLKRLTPAQLYVLRHSWKYLLRPEQIVPNDFWRYYVFHCGRGFGKTIGIAVWINERVELGQSRSIGLMAPNLDRVVEIQCQTLIDVSKPWFRPEHYRGGLRWPNGVTGTAFTPEKPEIPKGANLDLSWLTELVAWPRAHRWLAFTNITTSTRVGPDPRVAVDTTSRGRNENTEYLAALHETDPKMCRWVNGSMWDNPLLSADYLRAEALKYNGRVRDEEIHGMRFTSAPAASYEQEWLDENRRPLRPNPIVQSLVSLDPGLSHAATADETGYVLMGTGQDGHAYLLADRTKRMNFAEWSELALRDCEEGAAGIVVETNHSGNSSYSIMKVRAEHKGLEVRLLPPESKHAPFPARTPGVIYLRENFVREDKSTRALGPANAMAQGRVHLVGAFPLLEQELTTYEPGASKSPNRYDAFNQAVSELLNLNRANPVDVRAQFGADLEAIKAMPALLAGTAAGFMPSLVVPGRGRMGL